MVREYWPGKKPKLSLCHALLDDTKISPTEFVKDWVDVYHLGGGTEAQILFTRADSNDDGYLDANDVPTVFTYFDMNGKLAKKNMHKNIVCL